MTSLADSRSKTNRKASKAGAAPKMTVSLCLAIDHQAYTVTPIRAEDPDVRRAWRLEKKGADGAVYDVATTIHGNQCDCPDWEVRRNGLDPEGCKHVKACVQMGLLDADAAPVVPAAKVVQNVDTPAVETPPAVEPKPSDRCYYCCRLAFLPKLDADGRTNCYECRSERCDLCEQVGKRRVPRADGLLVCGDCEKRTDEAAELKAFLNAPVPAACPAPVVDVPVEPTACTAQDCQRNTCDGCQSDICHGHEPINQPVELPDAYDDEALELLDHELEPYDPTPADEAAYAAMIAQRHLDTSAVLGLPEAIDHVSDAFRAWGSPFGAMLAGAMEELALKCRMTEATTPAEFAERVEALDAEVRAGWEKIGRESVTKPVVKVDIDDMAVRRGRPQREAAYGSFGYNPCR